MVFLDQCKRFSAAVLLPGFLLFSSAIAHAATYYELAPQYLTRNTGAPVSQTIAFSPANHQPGILFTLILDNGGVSEDGTVLPKISSAIITLNGEKIFTQKDFNQKTSRLTRQVTLEKENTIIAKLNSKPGGTIRLAIEGEDSITPEITASISPAANDFDWHNTDVNVTFQCSDGQSGIVSCTDPVSVTDDIEGKTVTGTAVDKAGNQASTSVTINLDKTPPSISIISPEEGSLIREPRPSIIAQATDNFSLDEDSYSFLINGSPAPADCQFATDTLTCTSTADLAPGPYEFTMAIADKAGNVSESTLNVEIQPAEISYIVVTPGAALLTGIGDSMKLFAKAYDEAGNEIPASYTWVSSKPENVSVDQTGLITANASSGSAQIVAKAGDISSPPVIVATSVPAVGVMIIDDSNVIGVPIAVEPNAEFSVGMHYQIALTGIPLPAVGTLISTNGEKPVAGRVISAQQSGSVIMLVLEVVRASELFPDLDVNETIDLTQVDPIINPEMLEYFSVTELEDGTLEFLPLNGDSVTFTESVQQNTSDLRSNTLTNVQILSTVSSDSIGEEDFKLGPFNCEVSLTFPIVDINIGKITITPDLDYKIEHDPDTDELAHLSAIGALGLEINPSVTVSTAVEGSLVCKAKIYKKLIKLPGVLALLLPNITAGVGFGVDGRITAESWSIGAKATAEGSIEIGWSCLQGNGDCGVFFDPKGSGSSEVTISSNEFNNADTQLRIEPGLSAFGYAELNIEPLLLDELTLLDGDLGLKYTSSFATIVGQMADKDYKSKYELNIEAVGKTGTSINTALDFVNVSLLDAKIERKFPVAASPVVTKFDIKRNGKEAVFSLVLDENSITWPIIYALPAIYNVAEVNIYQKKVLAGGIIEPVLIASQTPDSDRQSTFEIPGTLEDEESEVFVFVKTVIWPGPQPLDFLEALELTSQKPTDLDVLYFNDDHYLAKRYYGIIYKYNSNGDLLDTFSSGQKNTVHLSVYSNDVYSAGQSGILKNGSPFIPMPDASSGLSRYSEGKIAANSKGIYILGVDSGSSPVETIYHYDFDGNFIGKYNTPEWGGNNIAANEQGFIVGWHYPNSLAILNQDGNLVANISSFVNIDDKYGSLSVKATRDKFFVMEEDYSCSSCPAVGYLYVFNANGGLISKVKLDSYPGYTRYGPAFEISDTALYFYAEGGIHVYSREIVKDDLGNNTDEKYTYVRTMPLLEGMPTQVGEMHLDYQTKLNSLK